MRLDVDGDARSEGWRRPPGERRRPTRRCRRWRRSQAFVADDGAPKWIHDAKAFERVACGPRMRASAGWRSTRCSRATSSTRPPPTYPLDALCRGLPRRRRAGFGGGRGRRAAVLRGGLARRPRPKPPRWPSSPPSWRSSIDQQGLRGLLDDVELPLASVLAGMEARGIRLDVDYLEDRWARRSATGWPRSRPRSTRQAAEEFNLELAAPAARRSCTTSSASNPARRPPRASCRPTPACWRSSARRTPSSTRCSSGASSTSSTPPTSRRCRSWSTHGTVACTPRSTRPRRPPGGSLLTTPTCRTSRCAATSAARSAGRSSRASPARCCSCSDYSQIELRILAHLSGDAGLRAAFASGHDIHTETAARVFDLPLDAVDPLSRSRAKMVNYGLAYGMNAWGLAQRLDIATR